jgi:hypothetical protein
MTVVLSPARTRPDDPEPALADLLEDGTLHVLMARDGVERAALETLIGEMRAKLGLDHVWPSAERFEASLFAECSAA